MSSSTTTSTTFPPFSYYPNGSNTESSLLYNAINQIDRNLTSEINATGKDVSKSIDQTSLGIRDAIERNSLANQTLTNDCDRHLTNEIHLINKDITKDISQHTLGLRDAVERGNVGNAATMERINTQLATAVERNGLNVYGAVERVAGENRITTVTTDASTRQANNDLARDITASVERNGSANALATSNSHAGLLQSVERNSGETRQLMGSYDSNTQARLADTRRDITSSLTSGFSTIGSEVSNAAWESRTGIVTGFSNVALEQAKSFSSLQLEQQKALYENSQNTGHLMGKVDSQYASIQLEQQKALLEQTKLSGIMMNKADNQYASMLLEQQKALLEQTKTSAHMMSKADTQFSINQLENQKSKSEIENQASLHYSNLLLEQQRVKEYLSSKSDNHFAMNQLEVQKVKSELASQAATNFSIGQLEQAKLAAQISAQMADAKYEALKTQTVLAEKMGECCCEIKQKIDLIDRDRLRDTLAAQTNDNNLLKQAEIAAGFGYGGPGFGCGGPGFGYGGYGKQNGPGNGNGDVNIYHSDRIVICIFTFVIVKLQL